MNSKLLVNDTIRSGIEDVDDYILLLENIVTAYTSDNSTRLVAEGNRVIGILADDLSLIAEDGSVKGTKLIKAEKNNMIMDRIVLLLKQTDIISSISRKSVSVGKEIAISLIGEPINGAILETTDVHDELIETREDKLRAKQDLLDEQDEELISGNIPAIETLIKEHKNKK